MNRRFLWLIAFRANNDRVLSDEIIAATPQEAIAKWRNKNKDLNPESLLAVSQLWEVK